MNLRVKNKWVLGLTGSILSGKSTALAYFARCGAATLSADEIVAQLYKKESVQRQLKKMFGAAQKEIIAPKIFTCPRKRKQLENLIHPLVLKEGFQRIKQAKGKLVVFEIPLLFEAGCDKMTDLNVLVIADPKTLPARLKGRNMTRSEYQKRLQAQWPEAEKIARADLILFHKDKKDLGAKIKRLCEAFDARQKHCNSSHPGGQGSPHHRARIGRIRGH